MTRKNKKTKSKKIIFPWLLLGIFFSVTIFFTILTSSIGAKFDELENTKADLAEENQILKSEIVSLSSLKKLEEEAYKSGFVKPVNILYVNSDAFVAKAR